jgi:hypothetical protein
MKKKSKLKVYLVISVFVYGLLWFATELYGSVAYRSWILAHVETMRNAQDISSSTKSTRTLGINQYYFHATAIAPFVISYDLGHRCGPLCGFGGQGIVLWLPNSFLELHQGDWWKS